MGSRSKPDVEYGNKDREGEIGRVRTRSLIGGGISGGGSNGLEPEAVRAKGTSSFMTITGLSLSASGMAGPRQFVDCGKE